MSCRHQYISYKLCLHCGDRDLDSKQDDFILQKLIEISSHLMATNTGLSDLCARVTRLENKDVSPEQTT